MDLVLRGPMSLRGGGASLLAVPAPTDGDEWEDDEGFEQGSESEWDDVGDGDEAEEDDETEEDDDEEGDWEEAELGPPELTRTLRFGVFAMAPLFALYELALRAGDGARAVSESLLVLPFVPVFDGRSDVARWALVGSALAVSAFFCWRHVEEAGRRVLRVVFEGALAAVFLIPLFQLLERARVDVVAPGAAVAGERGMAEVGVTMGAAAFDELLFRILLLSLAFVVLRGLLRSTGMNERPAGLVAAVGGASLAALCHAAAPLASLASLVGASGEVFHGGVFAWRVAVGLFLALLLVWRGVGVAAWAHALHHLITHLRP